MRAPAVKLSLPLSALIVLLAAAPARAAPAATLAQYRERVHTALIAIDTLAALGEEDAKAEEAETLADVRSLLPQTEKVEWRGVTTVVSNEWLHRALDDYERTSGGSGAGARAETLTIIAERLLSLESRLDELESSAAQPRDKDAEKGRLAAILRHPDFNKEAAQGGALQRLIEQIIEWIRGLVPNVRPVQPGTNPRVSRAAQIFVFALCLAVIAYVVWRFRVRCKHELGAVSLREPRVVLGEQIAPGQTPADLLDDAERLARAGDLRGAIRKAYIALLCELGERKVVRLARHKTNRDYLQAVRRNAPPRLYTELLPLTFDFELHWYGLEDASESDWADFRARCRQAIKAV